MSSRRNASVIPLLSAVVLLGALVSGAGALALLVHPETSTPTPAPPLRRAAPCTPSSPCIAVVIDDLGRDLPALRHVLQLDADLTLSVLPHAAHTALAVAAIRARGRELLLHLPLEPLDRGKITDERLVLARDSDLAAATAECLARVPGAAGVNNHLGSALSTERRPVGEILEVVRARGLFFLDSRTNERSVICSAARAAAVPCLERDVFLDDPPDAAAINERWGEAVRRARASGRAVAIGHPYASTLHALDSLVRVGARGALPTARGSPAEHGSRDGSIRVVRLSRLLVGAEM